ncbi:hypothetical protein V1264_013672 [Littorina saxatilis]|uniref:Polypeptide N-acetylgalactosaminyltransferase n=2 Tax=Littorina saxatilis TaxID=31220 RepID=A0AAN9BQ41_9CAEN
MLELDIGSKHSDYLTKKGYRRHLPHISRFSQRIRSATTDREESITDNPFVYGNIVYAHSTSKTEKNTKALTNASRATIDTEHSLDKRTEHTSWSNIRHVDTHERRSTDHKDIPPQQIARTERFRQSTVSKQERKKSLVGPTPSISKSNVDNAVVHNANLGWKPPPNAGENGTGVAMVTSQLIREQLIQMEDGYKKYGFNEFVSNAISLHRSLPPRYNEQECRSIQYRSDLPDASVVIIFYNEALSALLRTVHSVLDRSPPHLLRQVVLVDDFSNLADLGAPLDDYVSRLGKVSVVRATSREGLIRARLLGLRHVTATTVVFLDSHCECAEGWLEPLLSRIAENASHVVVPRIHSIDSKTFEYKQTNLDKLYVGTFQWNLLFSWMPVQPAEKRRRKSSVDPVRSPTMAGGLFAIDRDYFYKLGTYDPGMKIWGGENLELSFKIWMCDGTLEMIPCSNVGHVFRSRSPYGSGNNIATNLARLAAVWLDDYRVYFEQDKFSYKPENVGDVSERQELRRRLKCHSFGWYMKHVLPEKYLPADLVAHGQITNKLYNVTINMFAGNLSVTIINDEKRFSYMPTEWSMYIGQATIFRGDYCWDADQATAAVVLQKCHDNGGSQTWTYFPGLQRLHHLSSGRCVQLAEDAKLAQGFKVVLSLCNHGNPSQRWLWDKSPVLGPSWRKDEAAGIPVL